MISKDAAHKKLFPGPPIPHVQLECVRTTIAHHRCKSPAGNRQRNATREVDLPRKELYGSLVSERVRVTPGHGQQVKAPVPQNSLTTPNHWKTNSREVTNSSCSHNHIRLGVKRKALDVEINRYRPFYGLDIPRVGWQSEELNFIFRGDAVHTARSGLPPAVERVHSRLIPVDIKVCPPRTILLESLDAVSDGDTGCPIGLQPSGTEVEFVFDPERVANEVVETAVYLQEAWYSMSDICITPHLLQPENIRSREPLDDLFQKLPGKTFELIVSHRHMTVEGHAEMVAGGQALVHGKQIQKTPVGQNHAMLPHRMQ